MAAARPQAGEDRSEGRGAASMVIQRVVEWHDTDASGLHSNTFALRLMEAAETALHERLLFPSDFYGRQPRVHIEVDYLRPLRFRDRVDVRIEVAATGRSSVTYAVEVTRSGEPVIRGRLVTVLTKRVDDEEPMPWPAEYLHRLNTAGPQPPELLRSEGAMGAAEQ